MFELSTNTMEASSGEPPIGDDWLGRGFGSGESGADGSDEWEVGPALFAAAGCFAAFFFCLIWATTNMAPRYDRLKGTSLLCMDLVFRPPVVAIIAALAVIALIASLSHALQLGQRQAMLVFGMAMLGFVLGACCMHGFHRDEDGEPYYRLCFSRAADVLCLCHPRNVYRRRRELARVEAAQRAAGVHPDQRAHAYPAAVSVHIDAVQQRFGIAKWNRMPAAERERKLNAGSGVVFCPGWRKAAAPDTIKAFERV